jgi:hypothetical protein
MSTPKKDSNDLETPTREAPTTDEERIDESVDESFPASDPPAVHPHEQAPGGRCAGAGVRAVIASRASL